MLVVGVVAYNSAFLLAALFLGLWAWRALGEDPAFAASLVGLLLIVVAAPLLGGGPWPSVVVAAVAASVVSVVALRKLRAVASSRSGVLGTLARGGFVAATAGVFLLVALGYFGGAMSWSGVPAAFGLAELAAVVAACLSPWGLSCTFRRGPLAAAALAGGMVFVLAVRSPLVPLIATWSLAFSMHLPLSLYALGAVGMSYAVAERLPREGLRGDAAGLLILVVAGIGMRTTAEALLVVAGILLLFAREPDATGARAATPQSAGDGETLKGSAGSA